MQGPALLTTDRQQLKEQLIEAVSQLCRNALQFKSELTVEGLIGITLDRRDVLLVNINETFAPPVDISSSVEATKFPDISNPEVLSKEYFAHDHGSVASPSKRRRCDKWPEDDMHATTTQMRPPSLRIAKRKSSSSESHPVPPLSHTGNESGIYLETGIGAHSSETCPADADIAEYPETSHSLHCNIKLENATESIAHVNSDVETDSVGSHCQQDDVVNSKGYLSSNCRQSLAATAAVVAAAVDDVLSQESDQQCISDSNDHSCMDASSQLVISDVYSVKEETQSDDGSQHSSTLHCGLTANSAPPGQTPRVSQTPDSVTLAEQSSPLQVYYRVSYFVWLRRRDCHPGAGGLTD